MEILFWYLLIGLTNVITFFILRTNDIIKVSISQGIKVGSSQTIIVMGMAIAFFILFFEILLFWPILGIRLAFIKYRIYRMKKQLKLIIETLYHMKSNIDRRAKETIWNKSGDK
jgi:hypothetical protein